MTYLYWMFDVETLTNILRFGLSTRFKVIITLWVTNRPLIWVEGWHLKYSQNICQAAIVTCSGFGSPTESARCQPKEIWQITPINRKQCYCFSLVPNHSSQLFAVFYLDMGFHAWDGLWTRGSNCRTQGEPENSKDEADTCKPIFNVRLRSCVQWFCHLVSLPDIPKQHGRQQRTGISRTRSYLVECFRSQASSMLLAEKALDGPVWGDQAIRWVLHGCWGKVGSEAFCHHRPDTRWF